MNKNQRRLKPDGIKAGISAVLVFFVLWLSGANAGNISLPGQPTINLIHFITTHFIDGTLTIALARHIILFRPVRVPGILVNNPQAEPPGGIFGLRPDRIMRNHWKKELLLPGF